KAQQAAGQRRSRGAGRSTGGGFEEGGTFTGEGFGGGTQGFGGNFGDGDNGEFSDFFESLFGESARGAGGRSRNTTFRGQDYQAELQLSLVDATVTHQQVLAVNGKN